MRQMKLLGQLINISRIRFTSLSTLTELLLKMPKEMKHTATLRSQRLKIKEKGQRYSPGIVTLQVIGSGAKGAPRSLYVFTDQSRYLFNCGEGTQRLAHEHKMKLSKLEHIFLTHGSWENIGGLPGVALTIQDVGVPEITLHGPEGIEEIFPATRRFVVLRNLQVNTAACLETSNFEDNAIIVKYIPISIQSNRKSSPRYVESLGQDDIDYYAHERSSRERTKTLRKSPPRVVDCDKRVMCYAVKLQPKLGSLSLEKCVEAGVLPGPLFGLLKAGEDIVLPDGRVVRSVDVTMPTQNGPTFLVVECPSIEFLEPFVSNQDFFKYQCQSNPKQEDVPFVIVHFTPNDILNEQLYRDWVGKFPASTKHLVFNSKNICMGSTAVHRIQYKLNMMDNYIFPLLNDVQAEKSKEENEFCIINAKTFYNINLRPRQELDLQNQLKLNPEEYVKEAIAIDGFVSKLDELRNKLLNFEEPVSQYPNFTFLGTGSCIPNKTRNTSAILVNLSEDSYILLDCGEGTYGQMVRFFGPNKIDEVISKLKAIYISHLHADHHLGLIGVLKAHNKLNITNPIYLLAPKQIMYWLNLYDKHFEEIISNVQLFPNSDMLYTDYNLKAESVNKLKDLGFEKINTTYVKHCPNSFGVTFNHKLGWKVTYSGDTMPCESLIKIGEGSDLLIHEATMEDELEAEAKIKLHSTTSQAIEMGEKMKAKYTLLTHFSQRYAKLPRLNGGDSELKDNVGIAFDNMRVRLTDLHKLNLMYPAMKQMFIEDCDELEVKALKRQRKQEREEFKRQKIQSVV